MCAVSMVVDGWRNPMNPNHIQDWPKWPSVKPDTARDMLRVIELLEKIDRKLDARDCKVAEPDKEAVKQVLRQIIKEAAA